MILPAVSTATLRVLRPAPHVLAFYDGRIDGKRLFSAEPNWLDDGAYGLGVATYAIVSGAEALVYDTHISLAHARAIRAALEAENVRNIRVVLSHSHLDHIAGNAVFADCEIIAHRQTFDAMARQRAAIELGNYDRPPAIKPLVMPTTVFDEDHTLDLGGTAIEVRHFEIHSRDATVLRLPADGILFAGDALEDTITYVAEPSRLAVHLDELTRLEALGSDRILPNHGHPDIIAGGGYTRTLTRATQQYVRSLLRMPDEPVLHGKSLQDLIAGPLLAGWVHYYEPYEAVHRRNVEAVLAENEAIGQ